MNSVYVKYFDTFEMGKDDKPIIKIASSKNRVKKLLSIIMLKKDTQYSDEQLISRIWETEDVLNKEGDLKNLVYLTRKTLASLDKNADFIIRHNSKYIWNPEISYVSDAQELEDCWKKIKHVNVSNEEKLKKGLEAVEIYNGEIAANFGYATWALPISEYYNNIFLEIADKVCQLLEKKDTEEAWKKIIYVATKAAKFTDGTDSFYFFLFKALKALNRRQTIINQYEDLNKSFYKKNGETLSDNIKKIYGWAIRSEEMTFSDIDDLTESLRERSRDHAIKGAYYCDREMFKNMAHFILRNSMRNSHEIVVMLITIFDDDKKATVKERDSEMDILEEVIRLSLRKDDVFSRYSINQFLVMPFECKSGKIDVIEERITKNFETSRSNPELSLDIINFKMEEDGYQLLY